MDRRGVIVYRRVLVGGSIGVGMMVNLFLFFVFSYPTFLDISGIYIGTISAGVYHNNSEFYVML